MSRKGKFISFEGIDGSGKTTQVGKLEEYLETKGEDTISHRHPGGTDIAEKIRKILLDNKNEIVPRTETFMFATGLSSVSNKTNRLLEDGKCLIMDRYLQFENCS